MPEGTGIDIDEIFERIGGFGKYQKRAYFLMNAIHLVLGVHTLILTFIGAKPEWSCGDPDLDNCEQYEQGKCEPQYSPTSTSIVDEWNLICDKSSLSSLTQSAFFIGAMLGAWIWGTLADRMGRKKVFFITLVLSTCSGFGYSLAPSYNIFLLFRLLVALNLAGVILGSFVLSLEMVSKEWRTFVGLAFGLFFSVSFPCLAGLAYLIPNWRALGVVCSLLFLPFLLLWRIVPESPRWLLLHGREEECREVLSTIASVNGVEMPAGQLKSTSNSSEKVSVLDLFRGPVIRQRTMVLFIVWFANCMLYYALSLSAGDLGGNRYLSFSLSGLVEIPSGIVVYFLLQRYGRRVPHGTFLSGGGVACLAVALLNWLGFSSSSQIVLAMVGKFAVAGSFGAVYLYTGELFPTQVRNIGAGMSTIGARLGGIFSPIVLLLKLQSGDDHDNHDALPMLVLGVLGVLSGLLSFTLPETLNKPMPETLRELESN